MEIVGGNLTHFFIPPQLHKHEEWKEPRARSILIIQVEAPHVRLLESKRREHAVHVFSPMGHGHRPLHCHPVCGLFNEATYVVDSPVVYEIIIHALNIRQLNRIKLCAAFI